MRLLQEFLIAFGALVREGHAVRLHVCVQLWLLLKGLVRTAWTVVAGDASVRLQMLIERGDLCELLRTLIATILLYFVVRLHVIVQIGYLPVRWKKQFVHTIWNAAVQCIVTCANERPHSGSMQTKGRSPVCKRRWLFKFVICEAEILYSKFTLNCLI